MSSTGVKTGVISKTNTKTLGKAKHNPTTLPKSKTKIKPGAKSNKLTTSNTNISKSNTEVDSEKFLAGTNSFDVSTDSESQAEGTDQLFSTPKKSTHVTLDLLARRCLGVSSQAFPPDKVIDKLNSLTHVRLDREGIQSIDGLELFGSKLRNLYLQHNNIRSIDGLETLLDLRFLTLSNNEISCITNLKFLKHLGFLDLSHNHIKQFDTEELPTSLMSLSLEGNPCQNQTEYKESILRHCPRLFRLDGERLGLDERRQAGHDVLSESEESDVESENTTPINEDIRKPFDVEVVGVFDDLSTDLFLRCQSRIQQIFNDHRDRVDNLEHIRLQSGVLVDDSISAPQSRLSSRLDSPDTTDSSRPATGNLSITSFDTNDQM